MTIRIAGHVVNKFKNEFDITGAPQEIAGFFCQHRDLIDLKDYQENRKIYYAINMFTESN